MCLHHRRGWTQPRGSRRGCRSQNAFTSLASPENILRQARDAVTRAVDWTTFVCGTFSKLTATNFFAATYSISYSTRGHTFDFAFVIAVGLRPAFAIVQPICIVTSTTVRGHVGRALCSIGADTIFVTRAPFVTTATCVYRTRTGQLYQTAFGVTVSVRLALRLIEEETVVAGSALSRSAYAANAFCCNAVDARALPKFTTNRVAGFSARHLQYSALAVTVAVRFAHAIV